MQAYSLSESIPVPSSVLAQFSLPSSYHAPCYDNEPDYPANYEASPDSSAATAASSVLAAGEYGGDQVFSHSLLATQPFIGGCEARNEKEPYQPNDSKTCMISSSELVEQQNKHLHDDASIIEINAKARADEQYRAMKLKYLRSVAVKPPSAAAAARPSVCVAATPSYVAESSLVSASQRFEMIEKRRHDEACHDILPSVVEASTPAATTAPKPGQGLLSRLLSGRAPTAPSSPKTPSSPVSGVSPVLFPSASTSSLSSMCGVPSVASVTATSSSSSAMPSFVRRTSPISIPKRVPSSSDDDGVRYRKARMPTREELEEEERDRVRSAAVAANTTASSRRSSACHQSEFSFADVFAAPSMPSSSSRPIAIASKKSSSRMTVIPCHTPSLPVSHALPSSMLDGFLAL